ncbi:MAG: manganese efflux pump MntP family protein [Clostridiales bacterium]|jgi:putative Mn2+ efflux pump MntP|nr:manganese efflux pump MntP family protein [Clostridiales bacterium]
MSAIEIILIAVGLAMDAFAVSVTLGLSREKPLLKEIIIPGVYFAVFQAAMPLAGYFLGVNFAGKIQNIDHWIAFVLLCAVGGKMIYDSFPNGQDQNTGKIKKDAGNPFAFSKMTVLAVATSIDAFAVGITFAFFDVNIFAAAAVIGPVTLAISSVGVVVGGVFGKQFKSKAEFIGGAILVLMGVKILIEHLFFQ